MSLNIDEVISQHIQTREQIFEHFGWVGEVRDMVIRDCRHFHFHLSVKIDAEDRPPAVVFYSKYPSVADFKKFELVNRAFIFREGPLIGLLFWDTNGLEAIERSPNFAILDASKEIK